ncbi:MAG: RCC1 domain-containing protein [Terrimicrobiaceae bacterium]
MITSQNLIDKICCAINAGGLTALQTCQTTNALTILSNPVCSVANFASLPSATCYNGRMIFVTNENRYYHAVDGAWNCNFSSRCEVRGGIWGVGQNSQGILGDNTGTPTSSPVSAIGGITDWCLISAGSTTSMGLRFNGTAWAWGPGYNGRLGDGTTVTKSSPVPVVGGLLWCKVSTTQHTIAIRNNGTLWSWGVNLYGRLGDGTTVSKSSPVSVVGGFTDWCQVSAGGSHSLGVRTNGTAWAWGYNSYGRLGDGTTVNKSSPVSVVGGFTDWCQVSGAATGSHNLGVRTNGTAWAWGCNYQGQLGDGTTVNKSSPVSVIGGFTDWCQVSAGRAHSLGVRTNGTAWAWGINNQGQLGEGGYTGRSSPRSVVGGFTDWCQVSAGYNHSAGVRTNGTAWAWGLNTCGRLGDCTTATKLSPVSIIGGFTSWILVCASSSVTIGIAGSIKGC